MFFVVGFFDSLTLPLSDIISKIVFDIAVVSGTFKTTQENFIVTHTHEYTLGVCREPQRFYLQKTKINR